MILAPLRRFMYKATAVVPGVVMASRAVAMRLIAKGAP
jgi:hypothetical protein